jgi:hypothetical protein
VNALKELLAAAISSISSHTDTGTGTINPAVITNSNSNSYSDVSSSTGGCEGEDEIIVLDKENVNTGAFRRKGESGHTREQKEKERVGLGERSNAGNVRKPTLSDFMEEKEERERAIAGGSRTTSLLIQHPLRYGLPILNNNNNNINLANILKLSLDSQPHFSSTYLPTSSYFWLRACIPAGCFVQWFYCVFIFCC